VSASYVHGWRTRRHARRLRRRRRQWRSVPARKSPDEIIDAAIVYRETEGRQLKAMRDGRSYRSQVRFDEYVSRRQRNGDYGFRRHLKEIAAAGEV